MKTRFFLYAALLITLFNLSSNTADIQPETVIEAGTGTNLLSLTDAIAAIPKNAGAVTIRILTDLSAAEADQIQIPADRDITSMKLESASESMKVSLPEVGYFFANGIPLIIGSGISMDNAWVFGGAFASGNRTQSVDSTSLIIDGNAAYAFGGGGAFFGGKSLVNGESKLEVGRNAHIFWEAFGGGLALGASSYTESETSMLIIHGVTDYALGGGLARDGAISKIRTQSRAIVSQEGIVQIALFGGGSAQGAGSLYESWDTYARLEGMAGWAFGADFVFQSGETFLNGIAEIELMASGVVKEVYGGSFAADEGSRATVRETHVIIAGTAEKSSVNGIDSNGGISTVGMQPETANPVY